MSLGRILLCMFLLSSMAAAQSPDSLKFAPRAILLISGDKGVEGVMPMVFKTNGQMHLEYIPVSQIKESMDKGGQPIRLGDVLSALSQATETINQLQAENDKLWKVAMKDSPNQQPPTVIVQQAAPPQPSPLEKYLLLRSLLPQPKPYQLPMPVIPNSNRLQTNCTAQTLGNSTTTDCH